MPCLPAGAATAPAGVAQYADFKVFADEGVNETDVDAALQQVKDNDPKLKELNLNNIKVCASSTQSWQGFKVLQGFLSNIKVWVHLTEHLTDLTLALNNIKVWVRSTQVDKVLQSFLNNIKVWVRSTQSLQFFTRFPQQHQGLG